MSALAPVVIHPAIPSEITVLHPEAISRIKGMADDASAMLLVSDQYTAEALDRANALFREIDKTRKQIEADRLALTRPIDDLKAKIIEVERKATAPLTEAKDALGRRIAACHAELRRRHEEEQRRIREEAERQAAEARRIEAERRAAEETARQEAEAQRKAAAELFGTDEEPEPAPAPVATPAPVIPAMPVRVEATPAPPKSAVKTIKRQVLDITDRQALIAAACATGGALFGRPVLVVDEDAVFALLKAGVAVPGARLNEVEALAANRGRL